MEERVSLWRGIAGVLALAVVVAALSGAFAGASVALLVPREERTPTTRASADVSAGPSTVLKVTEESSLTETYQKVSPGVVTLVVQAQRTDAAGRMIRETNLGSGVVVDDRGYIVTNEHVTKGAVAISVIMADGQTRPGVLAGDDAPFTDIAVVRVQPDSLTVVPIGDSDVVTPGQGVLTIGTVAFNQSQFADFRNNVTRGIVSGVNRKWPKDDTVMEDLIQTDAAINHGNSGGALVTLDGKLVGITTTVIRGTQSGQQVQGVGFAISSKTFKPLLDQIIQGGRTARPYVGITHRQITPELVAQTRLPVRDGAIVVDVDQNSPAARAGIRRNDVITKLADVDITDTQPYLSVLIRLQPNSTVPATLVRDGREMQISLDVQPRQ